jgi:pyruvate kinase
MRDPNLTELLARRGAVTRIAAALEISTAAVSKWRRIPAKRAAQVAAALGVQVDALPVAKPRGRAVSS